MTGFKLIDLVGGRVMPQVWTQGPPKRRIRFEMLPGRIYTDYLDDPVFVADLYNQRTKVKYTPELEAACKERGIRCEVVPRTCTCQEKQLYVWYVEVID